MGLRRWAALCQTLPVLTHVRGTITLSTVVAVPTAFSAATEVGLIPGNEGLATNDTLVWSSPWRFHHAPPSEGYHIEVLDRFCIPLMFNERIMELWRHHPNLDEVEYLELAPPTARPSDCRGSRREGERTSHRLVECP